LVLDEGAAAVRDWLYVQSKVRELVRAHELRLSEPFLRALNERLESVVQQACRRCRGNGRRTLDPLDL